MINMMYGCCCIPFANIFPPSTYQVGAISPSLGDNRKNKFFLKDPEPKRFSVETSLEFFLQSLRSK